MTKTSKHQQRKANAARVALYRQRRKRGFRIVPLPIDDVWVPELLIASGCLDDDCADDPRALAAAVLVLLRKLDRDRLERAVGAADVTGDSSTWEELINSLQIV